jgi:hypothetical protein
MMQSVQVIIERLKTHPEDFFGGLDDSRLRHGVPKFHRLVEKLDDLLTDKHDGQVHRMWYLTDAERIALLDAYKEARRARFEAQTFHTLLTKQDDGIALQVRSHPQTGKFLMQGQQGAMWGGAVPKEEGGPVNV